MNFTTPVPRQSTPRYHESSPMRPMRDSDAAGRAWLKSKKEQIVIDGLNRSLAQVSREVQKLKRRIVGGGGTTSTATTNGLNYRGTYDPAEVYMTFDLVVYGTGTASGTYISLVDNPTTAPDSGIGWVQFSTASGNWL